MSTHFDIEDIEHWRSKAKLLFEERRFAEAEQLARHALDKEKGDAEARRLWKSSRHAQGKSLASDLPEKTRKAIYAEHALALERHLFVVEDVSARLQQAENPHRLLDKFLDHAAVEARKCIISKYALDAFELDLILHEGEKESWPVKEASGDRLSAQFVSHIERMLADFPEEHPAFRALFDLMSDSVLGEVLKHLRCEFVRSVETREMLQFEIETDRYFNLLSIVPASSANARFIFPSGYLAWLDPIAVNWNREKSFKHFVHWVYCFEDQIGSLQMTFLANSELRNSIPTIYPIDLLSPEEKVYLGV